MRWLIWRLRRCSASGCWRHGKHKRTRFMGSIFDTRRGSIMAISYYCDEHRRS